MKSTGKFFRIHLLLCTLYFVLCTSISYSQEKHADNIAKSQNTTVVNGVKYYLHTVEKGQTLFAIAKAYDYSLNDVVLENPEAINGIKSGQVLKIPFKKIKKIEPATTPNGANYIIYTVEAGQTLYSIAKTYNTSVEKLKTLNPELESGLKSGQTIKISLSKPQTEKVEKVEKVEKTEKPKPANTSKINPTHEKPTTLVDTATFSIGPLDSLTTVLLQNKHISDSIAKLRFVYPGRLKDEYNIAFFLPFHINDANEIELEKLINGDEQLSNKTTIALQFYEGALLAIDSLKKQKLRAKVFVYDIDDHDSLSLTKLLKKPELAKMDLMIGPLYGSSFTPIAKFAKEHTIPIVSPFIQINKILFDNLYVCKAQPSVAKQIEQMACYVIDTFHTQNIILFNDGNAKEVTFYNLFKTIANKALVEKGHAATDSLKEIKNLSTLENILSPSKTNVIVLPSNNQSYVTEFISKLNSIKNQNKGKFVLFGLSNWINYDNLDFEYLNNLSVSIPSNTYTDYQNPRTLAFVKTYYDRFKTDPKPYTFQGFDITYYFISSLQKYGSGFLNTIVDNQYQGIETNLNFMQYSSNGGFENKSVYILKYQDNKLIKAN